MIDDPNYDPNCYWSKPEYNHNHVFSTHDHHSNNTIRRPHVDPGIYALFRNMFMVDEIT